MRLSHQPRAQAGTPQTCPGDPCPGRARSSPEGPSLVADRPPSLPDPGPEPERGTGRQRSPRPHPRSLHVGVPAVTAELNREGASVLWGGGESGGLGWGRGRATSAFPILRREHPRRFHSPEEEHSRRARHLGEASGEPPGPPPAPHPRVSVGWDTGGENSFFQGAAQPLPEELRPKSSPPEAGALSLPRPEVLPHVSEQAWGWGPHGRLHQQKWPVFFRRWLEKVLLRLPRCPASRLLARVGETETKGVL